MWWYELPLLFRVELSIPGGSDAALAWESPESAATTAAVHAILSAATICQGHILTISSGGRSYRSRRPLAKTLAAPVKGSVCRCGFVGEEDRREGEKGGGGVMVERGRTIFYRDGVASGGGVYAFIGSEFSLNSGSSMIL